MCTGLTGVQSTSLVLGDCICAGVSSLWGWWKAWHIQNLQIVGEESLKVFFTRGTLHCGTCLSPTVESEDAQRTALPTQIFLNNFFHCYSHEVQEHFPPLGFHRQELCMFPLQIY